MHKVKGYYVVRQEEGWLYVMQCGPFSYEAALNELRYFRDAHPLNEYKIIYTDLVGEMLEV